jgi:hypothetical protein
MPIDTDTNQLRLRRAGSRPMTLTTPKRKIASFSWD